MGSILVAGSLHYDIIVNAPHLPARDETVMGDNVAFVCGGKGGNQAVAAARHGADVSFVGMTGDDFFAEALLENLLDAGVDTRGVQRDSDAASGMSVAIVETQGDYGAVVASGANRNIDVNRITLGADVSHVVLQNEIEETVNLHVADLAHRQGATVILNAAPMRAMGTEILQLVDILIVNRVEAEALLGTVITSANDAISTLKETSFTGIQMVIITLGSDGLVYRSGAAASSFLPALDVNAVSSHGAGDSFVGALACELANGETLVNALRYANAAAALLVSTPVDKRDTINRNTVRGLLAEV